MRLTEEEWRKKLSPAQYAVMRHNATEMPFTGELLYNKKKGTYECGACGAALFDSKTKFEAHCGWPSFYDALPEAVVFSEDNSHFYMRRIAVNCANCGSHLGHVFQDAPDQPTGQRYCINSVALHFAPKK